LTDSTRAVFISPVYKMILWHRLTLLCLALDRYICSIPWNIVSWCTQRSLTPTTLIVFTPLPAIFLRLNFGLALVFFAEAKTNIMIKHINKTPNTIRLNFIFRVNRWNCSKNSYVVNVVTPILTITFMGKLELLSNKFVQTMFIVPNTKNLFYYPIVNVNNEKQNTLTWLIVQDQSILIFDTVANFRTK